MKMSKKILKILMIFTLVLTFIFVNIRTKVNAYTSNIEEDEQELFIEETIKIFGNVEINSIEYLYNFNDSPDYVYVDFEGLGYVIYYRTTLEMMEYSLEFDLDYSNIDSRKYYAGPSNYYGKKNNKFIDVDTGDYLNLSDSDIELYANNLTSFFSVDADERLNYFLNLNVDIDNSSITTSQNNNAPEFDKKNFITPNAPGAVNTKYINNYDYFLSNPRHGFNEHGTCGSVAAQILLGYNNYYNDRRIIDVEHLYGDWIGSASSNLYDKSNYVYPERNMNVCNNPMSLTRYTTGTNNDFYEFVIRNIEPTAFNCTCTTTTIKVSGSTATVTTTIYFPDGTTSTSVTTRDAAPGEQSSENTKHTHTGASIDDVVEGLGNILSAKFDESQYSITYDEKGWFFGWSPISSTPIKAEIDSGRPLIIGLDSNLGGTDHWVVGYGYQDYNYPGDSETYSGYIVNFGWTNRYNVWINESWCDSYIALQMNHTHNLNIQTNNIIDDTKIELRCGECGYRTLDDLYTVSDNKLVSVNYEISGDIEIPENINGTQILFIGNNAFSNQNNLLSVTIPNTITNIDSYAFEGCTNLESVTLSNSLYAIGVGAFIGCSSLRSINIPASVQHIDSNAFENCSSLTSVTVNKSQEAITHIGENAFDGCSTSLQIIVPKNRLAEYKNKVYWSSYKNKIIPDSTDFDELNLHCLVDDSSDVTLSAGYNELYKLNVECNKSYKFMTSSGIELKVYDEYFDELYTGENTLYAYLSPGTYYLDVRYNSSTASGAITIDYELRWTHDGERVYYNDEHNLLTHLHETSDGTYFNKLYYINNNGAGLYKFQLNGTYSNNLPIVYDSGTLTIYNDSGRLETQILNRYPNSSIMASSDDNQDTMYVYLPRNGYFYINVVMPSKSYESLSLIVSPISSQNINLFNLNENANHLISVINNTDKGDYVETLNVEQTGKFTISYNYNGSSTDNFVFLLVKQNYNSTTNQYSFSTIINETMNATNNSFTYTGNLEAGKYYIGYLNKNDSSSVVVNFVRLVTDSDNQKLLPDPDMFTVYGSEVRFNNGVCRGTNLTVGFTRFIYLDNTLDIRSQSRLDYYWYSSDENVASISDYGTLLGLSPGTVKIMAVYKNDPSVVYVKQFTVLPDTRTEDLAVEISESITYAESGQIYEISLTDTNSPYPLNSLYEWSVVLDESSYSVTVTEWGTFSMSGTGTIVLEGRSKLNPHLVVRFTLIVT